MSIRRRIKVQVAVQLVDQTDQFAVFEINGWDSK